MTDLGYDRTSDPSELASNCLQFAQYEVSVDSVGVMYRSFNFTQCITSITRTTTFYVVSDETVVRWRGIGNSPYLGYNSIGTFNCDSCTSQLGCCLGSYSNLRAS